MTLDKKIWNFFICDKSVTQDIGLFIAKTHMYKTASKSSDVFIALRFQFPQYNTVLVTITWS